MLAACAVAWHMGARRGLALEELPPGARLLADALRRFLESHSARVTESMVMSDVQWGLHGDD